MQPYPIGYQEKLAGTLVPDPGLAGGGFEVAAARAVAGQGSDRTVLGMIKGVPGLRAGGCGGEGRA